MQAFIATTIFQRTLKAKSVLQDSSLLSKNERMLLHMIDGERSIIKLYASLSSLSREQVDLALSVLFEQGLIKSRDTVAQAAIDVNQASSGQPFNADQIEYFTDPTRRETEVLMPLSQGAEQFNITDHEDQHITRARIEVAETLLPLKEAALASTVDQSRVVSGQTLGNGQSDVSGSATLARARMLGQGSKTDRVTRATHVSWVIRIVVSTLLMSAILFVLLKK